MDQASIESRPRNDLPAYRFKVKASLGEMQEVCRRLRDDARFSGVISANAHVYVYVRAESGQSATEILRDGFPWKLHPHAIKLLGVVSGKLAEA